MNANKELWEQGDFTKIAESMRESGEALVKTLDITNGVEVLDLGSGDGTTALPAARLGAEVLAIDIASNLVVAGNRRAAEEGLANVRFEEGDASHLDCIEDESFDLVVSIFGAMFAPNPVEVAKEMVRVTRPGGRIVMGIWIPGDPTLVAQLLKISAAYSPPPPDGFISPMLWGVDSHVVERFAQAGVPKEKVSLTKDTYYFVSASKGPAEFIDLFRRFYAPTMNAFESAEPAGRAEELHAQLLDLAKAHNKSTDDGTLIPATFLRVTVSL